NLENLNDPQAKEIYVSRKTANIETQRRANILKKMAEIALIDFERANANWANGQRLEKPPTRHRPTWSDRSLPEYRHLL
ncbi:hypothetical protein ACFL54_03830, partial [Planctomycetota bacterium]